MAISNITLPSNIFSMKSTGFYAFLETEFSMEVKELVRLQGFSSAYSLIHSNTHPLDIVRINSKDSNLIAIKQLVAFHQTDDTWIIKPGIQYDVNCLMAALHRIEQQRTPNESSGGVFVTSDLLDRFPWLNHLIIFCQNQLSSLNRGDLSCLTCFIENIAENLMKQPNRYRYSDQIEEFAFVLYILAGRQGYEFIRLNLPGALPSPTTLSTRFKGNGKKILEGQFRFDSMQDYLRPMSVQYVFAAEDCTRIVKKVSYDRQSNSFVGFCPSIQNDGFPRSSLDIQSFYDLENKFATEPMSSSLNIHAIQPIKPPFSQASPFLLSAYGTDNKFETSHVINRWLKIFDESLERGIRVVGFSTDCDARYLRAMRLVSNFFATLPNYDFRKRSDAFKVNLPASWKWFFLDPTQLFVVLQVVNKISALSQQNPSSSLRLLQDPIHLATRIRNRMLSSKSVLLMGNQIVSVDYLKAILSSSSKLFHGLVYSDLNPRDHQNYSSCWRISRDEIIEALKNVNNATATLVYIKLLRCIIDAYIEKSNSLLDRIFYAWTSVFLSRLWRLWIDVMGKRKLDNLAMVLTENFEDRPQLPKKEIRQYFLTTQAVYLIELNAHCLIYLILLVLEGKLPEEVLSIERFHSQSAEGIFRTARSFSSSCSSGVNFTVLQFLNNTEKLSLLEKIRSRHEQTFPPFLKFPVHHKSVPNNSSPFAKDSSCSLPTTAMIERTICRAFDAAVECLEEVGIMDSLRRNKVSGIGDVNDQIRVLFNRQKIVDDLSQDIDSDTDNDDHDDEEDQDICYSTSDELGDEETNDENGINSVLRLHDDPDSLQPTFRGINIRDNVQPHLLQSYFKVLINGHYKFIHKSSACWLLTEHRQNLSSDRTKRVTQSK